MRTSSNLPRLVSHAIAALASALGLPGDELVRVESASGADLVVSAHGQDFVVEVTRSSTAGPVAAKAEQAAAAARRLRKKAIPLVVVPFMGESGKRACQRLGVSWLDLSGNAHIVAPGLRIVLAGQPSQFRRKGRPASVFAPKSSRVARWFLMHPREAYTQRQIAQATDMSEGFVSRIVRRLEEDQYVTRDDDGRLHVQSPELLLDAWQENYRFSRHRIIKGHVAARTGEALTRRASQVLRTEGVEHVATGLAAAWQLTRFATFRIATFYVPDDLPGPVKEQLGFREDPHGANLWLAVPDDAGVLHGAEDRDEIPCVHPVQAYLDLQEHPERSSEAADRLRAEYLNWVPDGYSA